MAISSKTNKTTSDYKGRFIKEYWETYDRLNKLKEFIVQYETGKLPSNIETPIKIFRHQAETMEEYLYILEVRAKLEHITLTYSTNA